MIEIDSPYLAIIKLPKPYKMEPQKWIQMAISCQFGVPCELLVLNAGNFAGMIHWLGINVIIPATPGNPTHPATLRKTHARTSSWTSGIGPADRHFCDPQMRCCIHC